jgi:type IV fimbrial biogenesis protein FimT
MLAIRHNPVPRSSLAAQNGHCGGGRSGSGSVCPMPRNMRRQKGITLIEIMLGIVIAGILFALAAPNFKNWIQGTQIRTLAESMVDGLQIAKSEAVHRNTSVQFSLTSDLSAACALSATGTSWVVSLNDPTNPAACNTQPSDTVAPFIVQKHSGSTGSANATVNSTTGTTFVTFNGLGRANNAMNILVSNPTGGACATLGGGGGPMRCMNVVVTTGGQVRMCDPALASTDPQGC